MKRLIECAFTLLVAVGLMGCAKDKQYDFGGDNPEPEVGSNVGYMAFAEEGLSVITDAEVVRAETPNVEDFLCTIYDSAQQVVRSFTYGERPTDPIELKVGSYTLVVTSSNTIPAVEWETPVYGAEVPFSIVQNETNTLATIKCKLSNVKVTVAYDAELYSLLEADSQTTVTVADNAMIFPYTETRAAYYQAVSEENAMLVEMSLNFAGKNSKMSTTIAGVKAGQWRKITVNMPHANEGNVTFTITIETLTLDEELVVDVAELELAMAETTIPDDSYNPLAPIISWEGHDLSETFQLMASHFDDSGNCNVDVMINMDANNSTFTSVVIGIESTNTGFMESLAGFNIPTEFDLCTLDNQTVLTLFKSWGIPTGSGVLGQPEIGVTLTNMMSLVYTYTGTHTFTMSATNAAGHTAMAVLTILVDPSNESGGSGAPTILWLDHNIDERYTVTTDLVVQIQVSAPGKIKEFYVDISGWLVDENGTLLGMSNLPSRLDLVNPAESYKQFLSQFFPTGDQVSGQTFISGEQFDISSFMSMLLDLGESGDLNFQLTVIDEAGLETVKTLMLRTE